MTHKQCSSRTSELKALLKGDKDFLKAMVQELLHEVLEGEMDQTLLAGTNIAYKAASDNVAPSNGWIGAMPGKPVGDANLDGKTNFQDYIVLEANFGQSNTGWEGGDFNTDGVVNFQDYIILERNFGTSYVSAAPAAAPVASPADLANSIQPTGGTDVPVTTGPVAIITAGGQLAMLNGPSTTVPVTKPTRTLSFRNSLPVQPSSIVSTPAARSVTWASSVKWQLPPITDAVDAGMIDLLGNAL